MTVVPTKMGDVERDITAEQLEAMSNIVGPGFSIQVSTAQQGALERAVSSTSQGAPMSADHQALRDTHVLKGTHVLRRMHGGLKVHTSDTYALQTMTTSIRQPAGITILVFLDGQVSISLGDKKIRLGRNGDECVRGFILSRARPTLFKRYASKGDHIRKVAITLSRAWLRDCRLDGYEHGDRIARFADTHLAHCRWNVSPGLVTLVEQMLAPPDSSICLKDLYLESRAISVVEEAFASISTGQAVSPPPVQTAINRRRLAQLQAILDADHAAGEFTLTDIARQCGMSASTLQRLFRSVYGTSVAQYLRQRRLMKAYMVLEKDGVSVAVAAEIAGYNNAANFATAFKRAFHQNPSDVRHGANSPCLAALSNKDG